MFCDGYHETYNFDYYYYVNMFTSKMDIFTCTVIQLNQAVVIARSLSLWLSSCKNFNNVTHYSIKGINNKLGKIAHHDMVQLQDKGHTSKSYYKFWIYDSF